MKRRYSVTLSEETVNEFQELAKSIGLRPGVMSELCDESIRNVTASMKKFRDIHSAKGSLSIGDLFAVIGEQVGKQVEEIEKEEKQRDPEQKQAAAPDKKRA